MILYALGKSGHSREEVLYRMPSGLVNQLMSCYWLEMGHDLESAEERDEINSTISEKLEAIRKRVKRIKFDF